jgi:hypothetical protein
MSPPGRPKGEPLSAQREGAPVSAAPPPIEARQPEEQQRYAALLEAGTRVGLAIAVLAFAAYLSGLMPAQVPVEQLPQLWSLPVERFLAHTGNPTGWAWLARLGHGDMAAVAGIAVLASCSLPCLLALVPLYLRRGERAFVALCVAEAAVIVLAASGWLAGGH